MELSLYQMATTFTITKSDITGFTDHSAIGQSVTGDTVVEGLLTGQTITRIDTEKTQVLNSLNTHITNYNSSETQNASERSAIQQSVDDLDASTTTAISTVQQTITDNKTDIEGKLATETNARLTLESAINNRTSYVDNEIVRLDAQHSDDAKTLSDHKVILDNIDTDLQNQISTQIAQHNTDIANLDPRVALYESKLVIDEVNKTITIPADYKLIVLGDFQNGS
mmetsp:Transcript_2767/g.5269  ORF Transcript_2767/g.5269 Transcript_2767/m.5269 type:complete len:225 (-) Transcript_2767:316-990(-)